MLSIIVSTYQENHYLSLQKSIIDTIGIPHEIVSVNNPNLMGICEAYNKGASKARYDFLLFLHEDVLFQTNNWGELLINHLNTEGVGAVGLAGSNYVPKAPSSWSLGESKYSFCNVNRDTCSLAQTSTSERVFALDGVFLAVRKDVFNEFPFNENIEGFHGYDTDFSLRVATSRNNYVARDIFISHLSKGVTNKLWLDNHIKIRKEIKKDFNVSMDSKTEIQMFYSFLNNYFQYYPCNIKTVFRTLHFLPRGLSLKNRGHLFNEFLFYAFRRNRI